MPIYEYQASGDAHCDYCTAGFETLRKSNDPEIRECPRCGAAVRRKISAPSLGGGVSVDPASIEKHGFTQYRRAGKGVYEKTAGKGPDLITDD